MEYIAWKRLSIKKLPEKVKSRGWSKPQPPQQEENQAKPQEVVRYKETLECAGKTGISRRRLEIRPSDPGL